jgi:hypothetical protein
MVVQISKITPRVARRVVGLISGNIPARKPTTPVNLMRKFVLPFLEHISDQPPTVNTLVDEFSQLVARTHLLTKLKKDWKSFPQPHWVIYRTDFTPESLTQIVGKNILDLAECHLGATYDKSRKK